VATTKHGSAKTIARAISRAKNEIMVGQAVLESEV